MNFDLFLSTDPPEYIVNNFFEGNEGENLRIDLQLDGNPLPPDSFSWTLDGEPLEIEPGQLEFGEDFIEFTSLRRTDIGEYMVTATNLAGTGSATFNVEVYRVWLIIII